MRLLIITQALDKDDPILGFFHAWVEEFARSAEQVQIICLRQGRIDLPENVAIHSLGKEKGEGARISYAARFLRLLLQLHGSYDRVFVHMNVEYLILAGLWWRLHRIPAALWYAHKAVPLKLRIAVLLAHTVFTSSRESFRMRTSKLCITGQGIELDKYIYAPVPFTSLQLVSVGRISEVKRIREMLLVCKLLEEERIPFELYLYGGPVTQADMKYFDELQREWDQLPFKNRVHFAGPIGHAEVPRVLAKANVFLNLSQTGSMDKAILEAMAAGVIPVTTNEAFEPAVPELCFVRDEGLEIVAERLALLYRSTEEYRTKLRNQIRTSVQEHSLTALIAKLISRMERTG